MDKKSPEDIAKECGASLETIYVYLAKFGLRKVKAMNKAQKGFDWFGYCWCSRNNLCYNSTKGFTRSF
jgi:hypothetical protein